MVKVAKLADGTELDISSLPVLCLQDILSSSTDNNQRTYELIDDEAGLLIFQFAVDKSISQIEQYQKEENDDIIIDASWGLDCEWRPNRVSGEENPVSVLQLSSVSRAFVIDLQSLLRGDIKEEDVELTHIETIVSETLTKLFVDPKIRILGFDIGQDLTKLASSFPHIPCFREFNSVMDLKALSRQFYPGTSKQFMSSLQKAVAILLNKKLDKTERCSEWDCRPLRASQLEYASLDATVLPKLLRCMTQNNENFTVEKGSFFKRHSNLQTSYRFKYLSDDSNIEYRVAMGSIKRSLDIKFARQVWPTHKPPPSAPEVIPLNEQSFQAKLNKAMVKVSDHAVNAFHQHVLDSFPDGLFVEKSVNDHFCLQTSYNFLFQVEQMREDQIKVIALPVYLTVEAIRDTRLSNIVTDFYNEILRDDPEKRDVCSDKKQFVNEFIKWKQSDKNLTRFLENSSPSTALKILTCDLLLISRIKKGAIQWKDGNPLVRDVAENRNRSFRKVVLDFYNQVLKDDPFLRESCSDRNIFTEEYTKWRETEVRKNGRFIGNANPSAALRTLRIQHKLIDTVVDGDTIVWTDQPNFHKHDKVKLDRKARIRDVVNRVNHGKNLLQQNRHGIEIDQILFGLSDDLCRANTDLSQEVKILNKSSSSVRVTVKDKVGFNKGVTTTLHNERNKTLHIDGNSSKTITVAYTPKFTGLMKTVLSFDIISPAKMFRDFTIVRYVSVKCGNPDDHAMLKPTSPYKRKEKIDPEAFSKKPERIEKKDISFKTNDNIFKGLKQFFVPKYLQLAISNQEVSDRMIGHFYSGQVLPEEIPADLTPLLNIHNYHRIFQHLLWIEETQMQTDIKNYDMQNVALERRGRFFSIHVPGLAESRPSVLRGDFITIKVGKVCYDGLVETTEEENAIFVAPRSLNAIYTKGMRVDVRFRFKRMGLRLCHDALDFISSEENYGIFNKMLFPKTDSLRSLPRMNLSTSFSDIPWFNRNLNQAQRQAVYGVMGCVFRPIPYIIFGPPGTGKTITLVESILQTVRSQGADPSNRVLICAPSNAATDLILQRLAPYLEPSEMIRVFAFSRDKRTVPDDAMKYSTYNSEDGGFTIPSANVMKKKKVVCITVTTGGKLPFHDMLGHFTHVFIDEAGQALEPELLGCIAKTTKASKSSLPAIILAGDPKQLGPIIRSTIAKSFGLEQSLLERLYNRIEDSNDNRLFTQLVENYRSHPSILEVPNTRFYKGKLIPKADKFVRENLQLWEYLPKKRFPLIFHGVQGEDCREGNSPSWFNAEECQLVKEYVDLLVKGTKSNRVKPEEIGIVTPYRKQCQKLMKLLSKHGYDDCKVGSVEEFQGSEKRVIIISTVRSSVEYMQHDNKHKLGFVSNSKRFNVAITRAQALLIVIGNPTVLEQDSDWKCFLEYCIEGGGYTGCPYNSGGDDDSDLDDMSLISCTTFGDDDNDGIGISTVTGQEGPAWRSEE